MGDMEGLLDDPRFWDALDELVNNSWRNVKEIVDVMNEHSETIPAPMQGLFIGGIGTFVRTYAIARSEANPPELAFRHALECVNQDPRTQALVQQAAHDTVDAKVAGMKEGVE